MKVQSTFQKYIINIYNNKHFTFIPLNTLSAVQLKALTAFYLSLKVDEHIYHPHISRDGEISISAFS